MDEEIEEEEESVTKISSFIDKILLEETHEEALS
jgi:hypothetical protein